MRMGQERRLPWRLQPKRVMPARGSSSSSSSSGVEHRLRPRPYRPPDDHDLVAAQLILGAAACTTRETARTRSSRVERRLKGFRSRKTGNPWRQLFVVGLVFTPELASISAWKLVNEWKNFQGQAYKLLGSLSPACLKLTSAEFLLPSFLLFLFWKLGWILAWEFVNEREELVEEPCRLIFIFPSF